MEEEGGGGGGNKIGRRRRRRQQSDGTVRDCYSPHGGGSVFDFNDGAPDKGDLDHSAHARLQESERRGRLFLPPPAPPRACSMQSSSCRVDTEAMTTEEGGI